MPQISNEAYSWTIKAQVKFHVLITELNGDVKGNN